MSTPRFSIITITYNAEAVLEPTIRSVLEQDYPEIEYLIIDGGSTDRTLEIVGRYREKIAYVVSERDKGLYDAMNKGLKAATGDYVWFMNAGDAIHSPYAVRKIAEQIRELPVLPDVIYGETALVDEARNFLQMRRLKAPAKLNWKSFRMGMLVCHQAFIAKRSIAPLYDEQYRFSADFDWCIRCMKASAHLHNTELILADYLSEGMTTKNRKASLKERFRIMSHYYGLPTVVTLHVWFAARTLLAKITGRVA
ncbi:MAG: glycosyltransferase family 2 protein [Bacteroidales bacterium]